MGTSSLSLNNDFLNYSVWIFCSAPSSTILILACLKCIGTSWPILVLEVSVHSRLCIWKKGTQLSDDEIRAAAEGWGGKQTHIYCFVLRSHGNLDHSSRPFVVSVAYMYMRWAIKHEGDWLQSGNNTLVHWYLPRRHTCSQLPACCW